MPRKPRNYDLAGSSSSPPASQLPPDPPLPLPPGMDEWFRDPMNATRLRSMLADPVMRNALSILLERARPTQGGALTSAVQGTSPAALGYYAGYADAIKDLRFSLTDPKKIVEASQKGPEADPLSEEPWAYLKPQV